MRATIERCELDLRTPLHTARGVLRRRPIFLLRVEHEGVVGLGEAAPLPAAGTEGPAAAAAALQTALTLLADGLLPIDPPGAWEEALLGALGGAPASRHAVDGALWDLVARRAGRPLAACLSSTPAPSVRVNALLSGAELADQARRAVGAGFGVLKLKVAAGSLDEDVARVGAVRDAAPGALLRLDANGGWPTARAALTALRAIGLEQVESIEQPVPPHDRLGLAWLRGRVEPCVAADEAIRDEADGLRLLAEEAVDGIVLKPMKLGGLGPCRRLAEEAAARGVRCWLTTTIDGAVARSAALHLAAAADADRREAHGLATGGLLNSDVASTPPPRGGLLQVPPGVGIGLDPADVSLPT